MSLNRYVRFLSSVSNPVFRVRQLKVLATPRRGLVTTPDNSVIAASKSTAAISEVFRNLVSAVFNDATVFESDSSVGDASAAIALDMQVVTVDHRP